MSHYDDTKDSPEKAFVNRFLIAGWIKTLRTSNEIWLLDANEMRTTRTLIEENVDAKRIIIVECRRDTFDEIRLNIAQDNALRGVYVHYANLFDVCRNICDDRDRRQIDVIYADLMQPQVESDNFETILRVCKRTGVQLLCITLCGRDFGGRKFKERLNALRKAAERSGLFLGCRFVWGYRRSERSQPMFVIGLQRERCPTLRRIREKRRIDNERYEVMYYGYKDEWHTVDASFARKSEVGMVCEALGLPLPPIVARRHFRLAVKRDWIDRQSKLCGVRSWPSNLGKRLLSAPTQTTTMPRDKIVDHTSEKRMRSQSPGRAQKLNWSAVSSAWQRYLTHWRLIDNGLVGFVLRAARLAVSAAALRLRPTAESLAQRFEAPLDLLDAFATLLGAKSADWSPFYARQAVALCLLDTIAGDLQHYLTCWGLFKTIKAVGRIVHSVAYVSLLTCVDDSERRVRLKHSVSMLQVMCDLTRRQWVVEADNKLFLFVPKRAPDAQDACNDAVCLAQQQCGGWMLTSTKPKRALLVQKMDFRMPRRLATTSTVREQDNVEFGKALLLRTAQISSISSTVVCDSVHRFVFSADAVFGDNKQLAAQVDQFSARM